MNRNVNPHGWLRLLSLRFLIIVLLALAIFFRFVNLDRKVYWHDEVYTSLRISGYTTAEVTKQVFNGQVIGVKDLQKYQHPNAEKSLIDVIKSLAQEDPQHPPLYFIMARFWVQIWGDSVAAIRSLSAFISLLVFPCVYLLCRELFDSQMVAWVAIALIAVSPFHVLYAQEAREYSLWTVTILLSSWALLQAMRLQTKLSWVIYAATLALSLYSFPLSGLVAIGHGIYLVATEGFRWNKTLKAYLLATLAGVMAFASWILVIFSKIYIINSTTSWTNQRLSLLSLVKYWIINLTYIFLDADSKGGVLTWKFRNILTELTRLILIGIILSVTGYSIYFFWRHTDKRVWLFILTLIGTTALALILPDLILGGSRSQVSRYLIPSYLGIHLAVAYLLATQIFSASLSRRKIWQVIIAVLISMGVLSCATSSQAENWWHKAVSYNNSQIASIINKAIRPLLISEKPGTRFGNVISLSYLLDPKVRLQLVVNSKIPKIPDGFSDVFLLEPSDALRSGIEKEYNSKIMPVTEVDYKRLWKQAKPL